MFGKQFYVGPHRLGAVPRRDEPRPGAAVVADDASFILVKRKLRLSSRLKLCCQLIIADTPRASTNPSTPRLPIHCCRNKSQE